MGCTVGKEKLTTREAKFTQKALDMCDQFNDLKNDIVKTRNLLYQKFNIKNRIKSSSGDSKNSIETQACPASQRQQCKNQSKNTTLVNIPNLDEQTTRDQFTTNQILPTFSQLVNLDDFIFLDSELEWKYLKETYTIYTTYNKVTTNHKNTQKICEMCRFFLSKLEEQIQQLEEINKQSDILHKCIRAFKSEIKNKQRSNLFNDLYSIIQYSKKMADQLKSTKSNVSQLSLMTLVVDTSDSLVNCNVSPLS